jgi:hypothetical protein
MIRVGARYAATVPHISTLQWLLRYGPAMNEVVALLPGWVNQLEARGKDGDWAAVLVQNALLEFSWQITINRLGIKLDDLALEFVAYDAASNQMLLGTLTGNEPEPLHTVIIGLTDDEVTALPKETCTYLVVQLSEDMEGLSVVGILPTDEHGWVAEVYTLARGLCSQFFAAAAAV